MPQSLKILSWNIEKFGEEKLADTHFISYVAHVIQMTEADVVGIMELVGWAGNETRDAVVSALNNLEQLKNGGKGSGVIWCGEASEMTPSRPNEQYLFIWKKSLFSIGQVILWNVIGETSFDDYFLKYSYSTTQKEKLWLSMVKNGWLDAAFMMPWTKFSMLVTDYKKLDLSKKAPTVALSDAQKKDLVDVLIAETPEAFPLKGSRPPFLLRAATSDTNTDITLLLYHAPGPGDSLPISATNQLSFIEYVQTAKVGVIMGDFNVTASECAKTYALQYFDRGTGRLQYAKDKSGGFIYAHPFQRITGPDFASQAADPSLSKVENYGKRLWSDKTSLTTTPVNPANKVADATSINSVLANEYDKFFVRAPKPDPSAAYVVPLIDCMIPKSVIIGVDSTGMPITDTRSTTATTYRPELGNLAKEIFNNWWDRQNNKPKKSQSTVNILASAPKLTGPPASLFEAHYVYNLAISDHLPICMEVQYA